MIFRPDLAGLVMLGHKTVTRRMPSDNPRSPWYRERCLFVVGRDYAVQPGRGKDSIGRLEIREVKLERLGEIEHRFDDRCEVWQRANAHDEGFESLDDFRDAWIAMHGAYAPDQLVWRLSFYVVRYLSTLQLHTGGFLDGAPTDHLIHLVRGTRHGTPGPTLCGFDRFGESVGFSVGGGLSGGGIVLTPCDGCVAVARDRYPHLSISGSVGGPEIASEIPAERCGGSWDFVDEPREFVGAAA